MRKFLLAAILTLLCSFAARAQCTLINSTTTGGNWSATGTWTGGVVPGANNCVTVNGPVVINQNLGATGAGNGMGWIRVQHAGASLVVGGVCLTQQCSVYFNSSGTNPLGSGTELNPGADATMYGFFLSLGTLNLTASATNPLTVTSSQVAFPIYLFQYSNGFTGCTTITANVCNGSEPTGLASTQILEYDNIGPLVGTASAGFYGIYSAASGGLTLKFCQLTGMNQVYIGTFGNLANISNNSFLNSTNANTIYFLGAATTGTVVSNNTEQGATTTGAFMNVTNGTTGLTFTGNAELGSVTVARGLLLNGDATGSGAITFTGNFCYNPPSSGTLSSLANCIQSTAPYTDTTSIIENNVVSGGYQAVHVLGGSPTIANNWILQHSDSHASQGSIFVSGVSNQTNSNTVPVSGNITELDGVSGTTYSWLLYSSTTNLTFNIYQVNQNTIAGFAGDTGLLLAEGVNSTTVGPIMSGYFTNNIKTNGAFGIVDGNENNTWNTASYGFQSSAVHHNLTYNQTTSAYEQDGAAWSVGFDNGTTHHPNALYHDLTVNPQFLNIAATPVNFDTFCDGVGTIADLINNLSYQSTFGGTYNPACSIANMLTWLQFQATPMNGLLKNAGACGTGFTACDIGAVPVYPATAMVVE